MSEWIKCSERLPTQHIKFGYIKTSNEVIIYDGNRVTTAKYTDTKTWVNAGSWNIKNVSHWMPLPPRPNAETP